MRTDVLCLMLCETPTPEDNQRGSDDAADCVSFVGADACNGGRAFRPGSRPPKRQRHRKHDEQFEKRREELSPTWNQALSKSTIRKTSREKDARALVAQFQSQTEGMQSQFQSNKTADSSLPLVQQTARNIEQVKSEVSLGPTVDTQWTKIRTELDQISQAFSTK